MQIAGTCRAISDSAAALLRWMMEHSGRMVTANMAVECGIVTSPTMFETHIGNIRSAMRGDLRLQNIRKGRYMWEGEPVELLPGSASATTPIVRDLRVRTVDEVATILGIPVTRVRAIESAAIRKLKRNPKMADAWRDLIADHKPGLYDPFHEVWLYHVAEEIHQRGATDHEETADE